jgi:HPt (histidine-containing phosphotransfer) domain-containing protein
LLRAIRPRAGLGGDAPRRAAPGADAVTELPATLPGIDMADGLRRVGGNARLYRDLLARLGTDFSDAAARIDALLARGQREEAMRIAHSLKGVAGNVGARELSAAAGVVEAACARGSDAERALTSRALAGLLQEVIQGLTALGVRPSVAVEAPALTVSQLPADLRAQLSAAAASADIDRLGELLNVVSEHDAALAAQLGRLIDNFDYEELQRRLES